VDGSSNYSTPLKDIKLGIYWTAHPPINRGLRAVVDTLRKAGHKVNRIRPIIHFRLTDKNIYKDGRLETPVAEHCRESSCPSYPIPFSSSLNLAPPSPPQHHKGGGSKTFSTSGLLTTLIIVKACIFLPQFPQTTYGLHDATLRTVR
jgi:hypothetical protein